MIKKGDFFTKCVLEILKVKGTIHRREIVIVIFPSNDKNYTNVEFVN